MSAKRPWIRGIAALAAWVLLTTAAIMGVWLTLSSTPAMGERQYDKSAVVDSGDTAQTPLPDTSGTPTPEPDDSAGALNEPDSDESTASNGWTPLEEDDSYERTFPTPGGIAVLQLNATEARLISASPAEGYRAETEQPAANRYVVTFYTASTTVVIDVTWHDGQPHGTVNQT